ncbi:MAG TPA: 50S ribosomal protein L32 [Chitinophagales bacterium]|nr:50S ribosomal protein L32 [Chitinophagales bacterium]
MAHPKRRTSTTRRDKRRTHYKLETPNVVTCKATGEAHLPHRAYEVDGDVYYNGKLFIQKATEA